MFHTCYLIQTAGRLCYILVDLEMHTSDDSSGLYFPASGEEMLVAIHPRKTGSSCVGQNPLRKKRRNPLQGFCFQRTQPEKAL